MQTNRNADRTATVATERKDLYQMVTDTIIQQLETGVVPWHQPWISSGAPIGLPQNFVTGNNYRGINTLLLWCSSLNNQYRSNEWASFKQWGSKNQFPRKGEKGSMIVFFDMLEKENEAGEKEKIPFLKSSYVFNRCQLSDYKMEERKLSTDTVDIFQLINPIEDFVENTQAAIEHGSDMACYHETRDMIFMPQPTDFIATDKCSATESYYATMLHELVHWSGHPDRLARTKGKRFADWDYAIEELVAELGSAFLCADFGIPTIDKGNHAA